MFVGRQRELKLLEGCYGARLSSFIPIYGRRRVGKSSLILRFLGQRRGLYFVGKQAPAELQRKEFLQVAARALGEPLLAEMAPGGWRQALETVVARGPGSEKLVLVFDEFQWTAAESPELPSVLQELWDRSWSGSGRVMLILCGSYVGFMEREVLGRKSPLFGRCTAQVHLRPFGYREAREFHPDLSLPDAAGVYLLVGGVPQYLQAFRQERSLESNIRDALLDEFSPLFLEPEFLLREELRDVHNYHAILMDLAGRSSPARDIARRAGVPERSLPYYLNQLVGLGYVRRKRSLTDLRPSPMNVRFALEDPLLSFWFRFVFPNQSLVSSLGADGAFQQVVRPQLASYLGARFEALCREALVHLYREEGVSASFEIGEYWDPETQVDVVGLRADGWTDLGECRWGTTRSLGAVAAELEEKVGRYPNRRNATIGRRLFLGKDPRDPRPPPGVRVHDLEALYGVGRR